MNTIIPNFGYFIGDRIAGSGYPGSGEVLGENLAILRKQNFRAILSLLESPLDQAMTREFGFECLHLPIQDFTAPTVDQVARSIEFLRKNSEEGFKVLVHCLGGYGRTGTILACYLVSEGTPPEEAIATVRKLRPGSIEVPSQEQAVRDYERHLRETAASPGSRKEA